MRPFTPREKPRITPARAGKTDRVVEDPAAYTDHPRACGENWMEQTGGSAADGSPPRVRGKLMRSIGRPNR